MFNLNNKKHIVTTYKLRNNGLLLLIASEKGHTQQIKKLIKFFKKNQKLDEELSVRILNKKRGILLYIDDLFLNNASTKNDTIIMIDGSPVYKISESYMTPSRTKIHLDIGNPFTFSIKSKAENISIPMNIEYLCLNQSNHLVIGFIDKKDKDYPINVIAQYVKSSNIAENGIIKNGSPSLKLIKNKKMISSLSEEVSRWI